MGVIKTHPLVKVFCAVTYSPLSDRKRILSDLEQLGNPIEVCSDEFQFDDFTDYYAPEMGTGLIKFMAAFSGLRKVDDLPDLKIATNRLEENYLQNQQRLVNLDPGYLTHAKVVLATTKDYSHRLYLGKGIFGDLHLQYHNKSYQPVPWTYPDYQQDIIIDFFNRLRESFGLSIMSNLP